jgi:hypothetical protein
MRTRRRFAPVRFASGVLVLGCLVTARAAETVDPELAAELRVLDKEDKARVAERRGWVQMVNRPSWIPAPVPGESPELTKMRAGDAQLRKSLARRIAEVPPDGRWIEPVTEQSTDRLDQAYFRNFVVRMREAGIYSLQHDDARYPEGHVTMRLTITRGGRLEKFEILESTAPELARHTTALVHHLGTFQPFPDGFGERNPTRVLLTATMTYGPHLDGHWPTPEEAASAATE